ncbi:ribosome small subunit-dependent GTPase A [Pseudogracilibacillus auburnensis]|uniref:ribosome small subunit-dependent GTPase A n=1 Tax=Pseudogracilibacillus auburnensis TaxID=1494959 RepID=UPI001A96C349|nr:ribosome small subunit-dependent GTPase A [Pseudogracilibacillus auburnensis]MBO1005320.1 ribosome small subunit-dependent GTPase A [Pseudogracilibacillus auburnensis]
MKLQKLGWNQFFDSEFRLYEDEGYSVGRIALEHKRMYRVITEEGEILAEVSGRLRFHAEGRGDYPAVGDWVVMQVRADEGRGTIHHILPRMSKFSRKVAGAEIEEQIVAANIDTIFLVMALNADFNSRRLERYLLTAWESGANPVIVLSKADLCDDIDEKVKEAESIALGVPIHVISAEQNTGLEKLSIYMGEGQTVALLGSSGVGKSTLVNAFLGTEKLKTSGIRQGDDKGRHTTTHRELIVLEQGGILIDTPGMRELQLWEADTGLSAGFSDVDQLGDQCKFRDCQHNGEPGCAIERALNEGTLDFARYESYLKLQKELAYLDRKENKQKSMAEKERWKKITVDHRKRKKGR